MMQCRNIHKLLLVVLLMVIGCGGFVVHGQSIAYGFVENAGQWDSRVKYEMQFHGSAVFLENDGITVALRGLEQKLESGKQFSPHHHSFSSQCHAYKMHFGGSAMPVGEERMEGYRNYFHGKDPSLWRTRVGSFAMVRYDELYPGVALEVKVEHGDIDAVKYNFIVAPGADASQIVIEYEGADRVEVDRKGNLVVHTSVRDVIEMRPFAYQEPDKVEVDSRWRVEKREVKSDGGKAETWRVWIELGKYDHSKELVIDPMLIFSTYTGSTADNWGTTAAYDSEKNVYTAGLVFGTGYPVSMGAYQETMAGVVDVGIFKFDTLGQNCLYATYLGGSSTDMPHSMFVNNFDELLIMGTTGSDDFPTTPGAFQEEHAGGEEIDYEGVSIRYHHGSDLFVSRLSSDGTQLMASTYVGGSDNDGLNFRNRYNPHYNNYNYTILMDGNDSLYYNYGDGARGEIITDNLNNVYVGSTTMSTDFPTTPGSLQPQAGGVYGMLRDKQDGVVLKLDHNLRNLLWCTYLGGSEDDAVYSIDVDSSYNLLVCGGTNSVDFPVSDGVWQTTYGGGSADGFVCKISVGGERLMASTFVGGSLYDQLYFVRTGRHDEVFLFGQTQPGSSNDMIYNASYSVYNSGMLLMRMEPDLSARVWSTLFGTPGRINLSPTAFAADICNRVYAAGWGRDFVGYGNVQWYTAGTWGMETTPNAWSDSTDGQDFYIIALDENAASLDYATFFGELHEGPLTAHGGGDHVDGGTSRFDKLGTLYQSVCGSCGGTQHFPTTTGAWSSSNLSTNCNNALFRFSVTDNFPVAEFIPPTAGCAPYNVTFRNTGRGASFFWDFGDGTTSTERNPTHTYIHGGIYEVTLIAMLPGGCSEADTQRHTLHVVGTDGYREDPLIACAGGSVQIGPQPQLGAQYLWLTDGVSDSEVANPWVDSAGVYLLRITAQGCNEVDTFEVDTYTLIDLWQPTAISCHDSTDGSVYFHLGPGLDPDSVNLILSPTAHRTFSDRTFTYTGLSAGSYHVMATGYGCTFERDFTLDNPPTPPYVKTTLPMLCNDSCTGWINIEYNLSAVPEIQPTDTLLEGLCEGTYITNLTTTEGCPLSDTTIITRSHLLDGFRAWADQTEIYLGQNVTLYATEIEGAVYNWAPVTDLRTPTAPNTVATPADTLSCYTVTVTTPDGCTAEASVCIRCKEMVCGEPEYVIPNAFTPNHDGVNDVVDFGSEILSEVRVSVFNRWGECVFESNDLTNCRWDGTYRNNDCLPGVYMYTCHIRCHNGVETDLKGDITLIR
ncbi:MAG: gliding motility-associated C-terminal domain-containing protein [bacterium]